MPVFGNAKIVMPNDFAYKFLSRRVLSINVSKEKVFLVDQKNQNAQIQIMFSMYPLMPRSESNSKYHSSDFLAKPTDCPSTNFTNEHKSLRFYSGVDTS